MCGNTSDDSDGEWLPDSRDLVEDQEDEEWIDLEEDDIKDIAAVLQIDLGPAESKTGISESSGDDLETGFGALPTPTNTTISAFSSTSSKKGRNGVTESSNVADLDTGFEISAPTACASGTKKRKAARNGSVSAESNTGISESSEGASGLDVRLPTPTTTSKRRKTLKKAAGPADSITGLAENLDGDFNKNGPAVDSETGIGISVVTTSTSSSKKRKVAHSCGASVESNTGIAERPTGAQKHIEIDAGPDIPVATTDVSSSMKAPGAFKLGAPTEMKAGARRPKRRHVSLQAHSEAYHRWQVSEFLKHSDIVNLGKTGIPELSEQEQLDAEEAFDTGMWNVIEERCRQAASDEPDHPGFPISPVFRHWMKDGAEEIFHIIRNATSRERRIVLGGIYTRVTRFTDLPQPTAHELNQWLVYGDEVKLSTALMDELECEFAKSIYVGSRTASRKSGYGGRRPFSYLLARAKLNTGRGISTTDMKSFHLRTALRRGAQMRLRVLATFDPTTTPLKHVLGAEGFFVDYLQSYSKEAQPDSKFHSSRMLDASIAAAPFDDLEHLRNGLNRAHPFRQGVRGCESVARRFFEANDWICLCCGQDRCQKSVYTTGSLRQTGMPVAVCQPCYKRAYRNSNETREDIANARNRTLSEAKMAIRHPELCTEQQRRDLLVSQDDKCSICLKPDYEPQKRSTWKAWNRYWRPSKLSFILLNTIICQACEHAIEIGPTLADAAEEHAWVEKRRDVDGLQAFLDSIGAPTGTTVTMTQTMKLRLLNWPQSKAKWEALMANQYRCFCCQKAKWT